MTEKDFCSIVYIDDTYTDFLRYVGDFRVSYNIDKTYQRPYIGVIFAINSRYYFAPMTSKNKGQKLRDNPKMEDETFLPINNCENGGINFNNMIPVMDKVFHKVDLVMRSGDPRWLYEKKLGLINSQRWIRHNIDKIVIKALHLYDMKNMGQLRESKDNVTCDFRRLEIAYGYYGAFINDEFTADEIVQRVNAGKCYVKTYLQAPPAALSAEEKVPIEKRTKTQEKTVIKTMVLEPKNKPKKRPVNYK